MDMIFGEQLKRIRTISGKTQENLAQCLGVPVVTVSEWEEGVSFPTVAELPRMAAFFQCTINAFFSEYELRLFEVFNAIPEKGEHERDNAVLNERKRQIEENGKADLDPDEMDPEDTLPIESLFLPALYTYLRENEYLSVAGLQKNVRIGYLLASDIVHALIDMGIVKDTYGKRKIVKEKIDLLLPYMVT